MARGGSSVLLMGINPVTGERQAVPVSNLTGALEVEAVISTSLGDIVQLPDDLYKMFDTAAGGGATRAHAIQTAFNAIAGVTTSVVRSIEILLKDSGSPAGDEIGSVKFKTSTMAAFGDAIPLFNDKAETFSDWEGVEVELTLTAQATTRSLVHATGRKLT